MKDTDKQKIGLLMLTMDLTYVCIITDMWMADMDSFNLLLHP